MNISRRLVIFILFLFVALLVGILYWPFILNEVITPVSIVLWLLLRILVLSIDQKYYWGAAILALAFFLYRFLPREHTAFYAEASLNSNSTLRTIGYWRDLFTFSDQNIREDKTLKREFVHLLISLYATKQRTTADFWLYKALQQGELPLPEHIHAFLFWEEPQDTRRSLKMRIQSLGKTPQKWIHRLTGQEIVEHNRMIDEVLGFMETALEIKNDNGKFNPN